MAKGNVNDVLNRAKTLLNEGKPQEAMTVLAPHLKSGSKLIINAYGVCLMRLGQHEEAMTLLRALAYQGSSLALDPDLPTVVKTNLATAFLLTQNVDGAQTILSQLDGAKDEAVTRLRETVAGWKKSLTFFQRLQCMWGTPRTCVSIGFPPGDV